MQIDPRGPRFGAVVTTVVLAIVIVTGSAWLLAAQALIFAPPRFAQGVGLAFALGGLIGFGAGITPLALGATAAALLAAFLNAAFGLCLGCEMYLLIRRLQPGRIQ